MVKLLLACALLGQTSIEVSNERDWGNGSFRAAIERAERDPFANDIVFDKNVKVITLNSPIIYKSALPLYVHGPIEIRPSSTMSNMLQFRSCSNVSLNNIRLIGGGVFIDKDRIDKLESIFSLNNVLIRGVRGTGIRGSDYSRKPLTLNFNNVSIIRSSGAGCYVHKNGADLNANLNYVLIENNGHNSNSDGMQLCATGDGDLNVKGYNIDSYDNAEDGLELEEAGDGNLVAELLNCYLSENGEENLECNENDRGGCTIVLDYVICDGYKNNNNRNDGAEIKSEGEDSLNVSMYKCRFVGSEFDGLRIIPIGSLDVFIELKECELIDCNDEGFDYGPRENTIHSGFSEIYIFDSIINYNFGNGIKAVASSAGSAMYISGDFFDYSPNLGGNLDTENTFWWFGGIAKELD